ncbi:hypothetical protein BUALT_Bualt07G0026800 [Buddleja alternifolia]|uniref:Uncharacterized protein n=1 Tax=Buddleja alternifolia TaxID=168488 RepID=A0AAV6XFM4_9LAMI|nr:hypothetical protein BUALT_Bualt07G0026800 [Buddleja alternifolia]
MQNPLNWPVKVIGANSMYRITQTILLAHKDDDQETDEELFERLSVMISDIFAACLTNLVHFIRFECHSNVIKERVKRVGQAVVVLGESEEIIEILQQRELPDFCMDPAKAANIEEWRMALMEVDNENPFASISAVSRNAMSVPQSNEKEDLGEDGREVRIRCFNSTVAKWDEREDDEEAEDDLEGVVWLGGFVGFADLILAQYVSISVNVWRCSEFENVRIFEFVI